MPTFLDTVRIELENTDGRLIEPTAEVGKKDHVVGVADEDIRKLYGLAMQWDKVAMETAIAARYVNNRADQEQSAERALMLHKKSELLMDLFWASLKDAFDLWQKPSVGIREGWKIVWSEPEVPPIIGLLGKMLGGEE